jgi:hypothetical protein
LAVHAVEPAPTHEITRGEQAVQKYRAFVAADVAKRDAALAAAGFNGNDKDTWTRTEGGWVAKVTITKGWWRWSVHPSDPMKLEHDDPSGRAGSVENATKAAAKALRAKVHP